MPTNRMVSVSEQKTQILTELKIFYRTDRIHSLLIVDKFKFRNPKCVSFICHMRQLPMCQFALLESRKL